MQAHATFAARCVHVSGRADINVCVYVSVSVYICARACMHMALLIVTRAACGREDGMQRASGQGSREAGR